MRFSNVGTVYRKELLDQLRDRRTIFSMVVIPIVLFPLMTIGFGMLAARMVERARQQGASVMLLGAEHAPALAERIRSTEGIRIVPVESDYKEQISDKKIRVALQIPPGFEAGLRGNHEAPTVKILHYAGEIRSQFALRTLQKVLGDYRDEVVEERLRAASLSPEMLEPFKSEEENVAPPEKVGGAVLGGLIPYFIIILTLTGAAYPAIDLTAGEKERGTIETILASPVSRVELVVGKFLMVVTASLTTSILAIASFAATFLIAGQQFSASMNRPGTKGMAFVISGKAIAAVFFMVLPLAVLFSGALLAIALLAKSYKEAQSYIQPLIIVAILPAIVALLPGVELNSKLALVPVLNVSLVSKEILTGNYPWGLIALIFGSSSLYAAAALFVAVRAFQRESVLFRT